MTNKEIQENLELAQTILGQWLRFREYYRKGVSGDEITMDDEQAFLDTKSTIAQNIRKLGQRIDEKMFPFRQNEISAQLKGTVSVSSFKDMNEPDRKKFYSEWYHSLTYLTRTVGALKFLNEGYRPPVAKKAAAKGRKKGKGKLKKIIIALAVLGAAGAGYVVFFG